MLPGSDHLTQRVVRRAKVTSVAVPASGPKQHAASGRRKVDRDNAPRDLEVESALKVPRPEAVVRWRTSPVNRTRHFAPPSDEKIAHSPGRENRSGAAAVE